MPISEPTASSSAALPAFTVGQKLAGVYVLRKEAGEQGSAPIWLAHDEVLGKDVSLHFIPPTLRADERVMGALRQEIKRNRQLIHPGILRVYDLVEEPDWSAISMDWYEGHSLATLLKQKKEGFFEPAEVKAWLQQVCQTLDDIHKINIVHRDVAPHHVYVDATGKVLLAKFGVGRVIEDAQAKAAGAQGGDARLGSLSPQTLDGENPSKFDDIYSLGATIYELLTGELPFTGSGLLAQIRKNPPQTMSERRAKNGRKGAALPQPWEKGVATALAKPTTERPQTAGELATRLGLTGKLKLEPPTPATTLVPSIVQPGAESSTASLAGKATPPVEKKEADTIAPIAGTLAAAGALAGVAAKAAAESKPAAAAPTEARTKPEPAGTTEPPARVSSAEPASPSPARSPDRGKEELNVEALPSKAAVASSIAAIAAATSQSSDLPPKEPAKAAVEGDSLKAPAAENAAATPSKTASIPPIKLPARPEPETPSARTVETKSPTRIQEGEAAPLRLDGDNGGREKTKRDDYLEETHESRGIGPVAYGVLALLIAGGLYYYFSQPSSGPSGSADGPTASLTTPVPQPETPAATPVERRVATATPAPAATGEPVEGVASSDLPPSPGVMGDEPSLVEKADAFQKDPNLLANARNGDRGPELGKPNTEPTAPPAFTSSGDPEKDYLNALKQRQDVEKEVGEVEKSIQKKTKEIAPVLKSTEGVLKQRMQHADQIASAEQEEKTAKQALEAKAAALTQARKTLADWEAANASKLAPRDKATKELEGLQAALTVKQQQASDLAKAVASADAARQEAVNRKKAEADAQQQQMAARKAAEEAERKKAAEAQEMADEKARRAKEIQDQINKMQEQLRALQANNAAGQASTEKVPEGGPSTTIPTKVSATPPPAATATPVSTPRPIPVAPPTPQPIRSGMQNEFLPPLPNDSTAKAVATPTAVAALSTPAPRIISSTPPSTPAPATSTPVPVPTKAATPEGGGGENSLGMKFVPVGNVEFCVWPVRYKDFEVFAKETNLRSAAWRSPGFKQGPDHPVVNVSWKEAMAFCEWLTARDRKQNLLTKEQSYRLPTDEEWSQGVGLPEEVGKTPEARDLGVRDVFPWGTQWPPPPNVGNYTGEETQSDVAIKGYDDGFVWTSPVGSFPPNKFGLYDMGGNVWQWCMDNYSAESRAKVLRGASWYNGALKLSLQSSSRAFYNPESGTDNYGFRVVRVNEAGKPSRSYR